MMMNKTPTKVPDTDQKKESIPIVNYFLHCKYFSEVIETAKKGIANITGTSTQNAGNDTKGEINNIIYKDTNQIKYTESEDIGNIIPISYQIDHVNNIKDVFNLFKNDSLSLKELTENIEFTDKEIFFKKANLKIPVDENMDFLCEEYIFHETIGNVGFPRLDTRKRVNALNKVLKDIVGNGDYRLPFDSLNFDPINNDYDKIIASLPGKRKTQTEIFRKLANLNGDYLTIDKNGHSKSLKSIFGTDNLLNGRLIRTFGVNSDIKKLKWKYDVKIFPVASL